MAKREVKTDLWVYNLLRDAQINFDAQGSSIKEINEALKTASKNLTGKVGFPEYVAIVKDFLLVIEDKPDISKHIKKENDVISSQSSAIKNYAVNGAVFYAQHIAKHTSYKKIIAFGISGAVQHTCAIEGATTIIAVNNDKNARIFDYADYGILYTL